MNVIFLDFDGVLDTIHYSSDEDIERRIKILSDICHEYNCKVVIEASAKDAIDEKTMEIHSKWVKYIFDCFKKYNIECIGRTPSIKKNSIMSTCKEDEIRLFLFRHPEIEHYCVIDDDDLAPKKSDLNKVRKHLVKTLYFSDYGEYEGLLEKHKYDVLNALNEENEIKKLIPKNKL